MSQTDKAIEQFVQDVRLALADLQPATVAQLTEGLEGELAERSADEGAKFALGSATSFARELRESAGVTTGYKSGSKFAQWRASFFAKSWQFAKSLTPVWWLLRAITAYDLLHLLVRGNYRLFPDQDSSYQWLVLILFVIVSVQFGRGVWRMPKIRWVLSILNVAMALLVVPFAITSAAQADDLRNQLATMHAGGIVADGYLLYDVRALDANGAWLPMTRLTDANGYTVYKKPDFTPTEFKSIIGLSKEQATTKLLAAGYASIQSKFVLAVGVAKGLVIDAQHSADASGNDVVELTISAGATK